MADHSLTLKAYLDTSQVKAQISQLNSQGNVNLDASGITNSLNRLNDVIGKFIGSLDKLQQNTAKQAQQSEINYGRLAKFAAGMATHQLAGAAGRYLTATGNETAASVIGTVGTIGSNIAMGAAAGGPIGAAVGAGVGLLSEALNSCATAAENASKKLEEWTNRIHSAVQKDQQYEDIAESKRIKSLIDTGSDADIQTEARKYEILRDQQTERIQSFKGKYGSILEAEQAALATSDKDEEKSIRKEISQYEEAQKWAAKYESRMDQLNEALEKRAKAEKDAAEKADKEAEAAEKKRQAEEEQAKKLAEANAKHIEALKKSDAVLEESEGVNEILKQSDVGTISETLSKYKSLTEQAYAKYQEDLAGGDAEKATSSRAEWTRLRGYQKSLESGLYNVQMDKLNKDYDENLDKLSQALQGKTAVSDFAAMGGGMGWAITEDFDKQINDRVGAIKDRLSEILTELRNLKNAGETGGIIL